MSSTQSRQPTQPASSLATPTTAAVSPTTIKKASPSTGPAGPAPSSAPPATPANQTPRPTAGANASRPAANLSNGSQPQRPATNGTQTTANKTTKKKAEPSPPDPSVLYENVKNRIAALEEAAVQGEEEERKTAEEARSQIKGHSDSVIQSKYIELFQEMKRMERDHTKEKQKLVKEKDASKSQLTKATASKAKLENLARELQKDNKKLREDTRRLAGSVDDAQEEIASMKEEMERRFERAKKRERKIADAPDVMVKVTCKYRAELFFKISRKTKLSRLFNVWTERMDVAEENARIGGETRLDKLFSVNSTTTPTDKKTPPKAATGASGKTKSGMQFMFTHLGRIVEPEQTPDDLGMESGDEIVAIEMMDLTIPNEAEDLITPPQRERIKKNWTDKPAEAKAAIEEIFDGVVRERLKDVLRQYERRERHFECVIRSKELEVLVSRARAEEQKQVAEGERQIASVAETQNLQLHQQMEDMQSSQSKLMDKLIACCKEPTGERTQRLFSFLREELEKRGTKLPPEDEDGPLGTGDNSEAEPSHTPSPIDSKRGNHLSEEEKEDVDAIDETRGPTTISV